MSRVSSSLRNTSVQTVALLCWLLSFSVCDGFVFPASKQFAGKTTNNNHGSGGPSTLNVATSPVLDEEEEIMTTTGEKEGNDYKDITGKLSVPEIKTKLLDLLPSMTGTEEELRLAEAYVNALEDRYMPAQTLGFLNMAIQGDWQLLFSTNLSLTSIRKLRLRELYQRIETKNLEGTVTNNALWDLADGEDNDSVFDCSGLFAVKCSYKINQGARMILDIEENIIKPAKGSKIPSNVEDLVARLNRAMPKELFDPNEHAMDTTYVDTDLRIVRMTGPKFEGVRNIFIRRGSLEINPTS